MSHQSKAIIRLESAILESTEVGTGFSPDPGVPGSSVEKEGKSHIQLVFIEDSLCSTCVFVLFDFTLTRITND